MSVKIVVVPEDDRLDKYVLEPVFTAMLAYLGRPKATVRVVDNPKPRGLATVLRPEFVERVVTRYPMADVFVYCLDRDGRPGREDELRAVLDQVRARARPGQSAEGVLAVQEVEVWCLVTHFRDLPDSWDDVRREPNPKERYFAPLVNRVLPVAGPGRGRQALAADVARRYDLLRVRCPEVQEIEASLAEHLR